MITLSLRDRLLLLACVLLIGLSAVLAWFFLQQSQELLISELKKRGVTLASNLAFASKRGVARDNIFGSLDPLVDALIREPDVAYVAVLNADGTVLAHSDSREIGVRYDDKVSMGALTAVSPRVTLSSTDSTTFYDIGVSVVREEEVPEASLLGSEDDATLHALGAVRVGVSPGRVKEQMRSILTSGILISASVVSVSIVLFVLFANGITRPLGVLVEAMNRIAGGDFAVRTGLSSRDEIGKLASSCDKMAEDLARITVSRDYVESIIECMNDSLIVIDERGEIRSINGATEYLLGYTSEELVGKRADVIFDREASRSLANLDLASSGGNHVAQSIEMVYTARNGRKIPVLFSRSQLVNAKGTSQGMICVAQDLTERKKAEEELKSFAARLERSNCELQDFASVASHDLQEPLRKVRAFGDRLQTACGEELPERGRDYLERMQNAASRMQTLINDLLLFSRVTTKAQPFVEVDLSQITHEVISDLEIRLEQLNGRVEIGDLPVIDADPLQMRQLLQNLIGNALKFHRPNEPPVVKVFARPVEELGQAQAESSLPSGLCRIYVEDNGIGFEEKYLDRIFSVFQRLHGRSEYEGTGVGLAICRKIADRHGGSITARSTPGEGTTFIVTLPVRQQKGERYHDTSAKETDYHPVI